MSAWEAKECRNGSLFYYSNYRQQFSMVYTRIKKLHHKIFKTQVEVLNILWRHVRKLPLDLFFYNITWKKYKQDWLYFPLRKLGVTSAAFLLSIP